ncbi:N-acetyltransferase [Butyrivibrio sp. AE3004]|uniref:N-acetyltransferase n=1 Tax=Butyrivibrio sp. AE3004 TaxID=1506994 RepID=UPI0004946F78|nr:N-acetyltransferase [Butyrivibrio sp. AE3004]
MSNIAENVIFGQNVTIGNNVTIKAGCILEDNIVLGDNTYIDFGTIIHSNVEIGENTVIGARCILGEYLVDFYEDRINKNHKLEIGKNSLIRSETIIYGDNKIGAYFQTGHRVTIRENSKIGEHVRIGTLSDIQGNCEIQDYVSMHSNVHIGMKSVIKKYAMIFPYVVLTNDPNPPSESLMGVTIEEFAIVATGTVVLPGKTIGNGALVGAGSIVTKDVAADSIAVGNPAKDHGPTEKIKDAITGEQVYPWRYTFDRGMPWEGIGYNQWIEGRE